MSRPCRNPEIRDMLYAYELGMLDDGERTKVETHLMDCEECFESARAFREAAALLRESEAVRSQSMSEAPAKPSRKSSSLWRLWIPAAAVLVFLLLKPWQLEFHHDLPTVAAEARLAVLPFENLTTADEYEGYGDMISELLVTDLSESSFLQVVSTQRIRDVRRLLDREASSERSEQESATEIARRAEASWMLVGRLRSSDEGLLITAELVDVSAGVVKAAREVSVSSGSGLFGAVDQLSADIKVDLGLPDKALREDDRPVAEVTTNSPEAYKAFLEGLQFRSRVYNSDAIRCFERAIEYDSTFAMAYYHLSELKDASYIEKAAEYASGATQRERYYIRAGLARVNRDYDDYVRELTELVGRYPDEKDAYLRLGRHYTSWMEYDSAAYYLNRAVAVDSLYKEAYNALVYAYDGAGEYDKAVEAISKYIRLAPDEANPYDTRGDLYAYHGRLKEAIESYRSALERKPDFSASAFKLAAMYCFDRDYARCDSVLTAVGLMGSDEVAYSALVLRIYLLLNRGLIDQALAHVDATQEWVDGKVAASKIAPKSSHLVVEASIYSHLGNHDRAISTISRAIDVFQSGRTEGTNPYRYLLARYLAEVGQKDSARTIERQYRNEYVETGIGACYRLWIASDLAMIEGNFETAVDSLTVLSEMTSMPSDFHYRFELARAELSAGRLADAVELFEGLKETYSLSRFTAPFDNARLPYLMGLAYEESRWYDKAIGEYTLFLEQWERPDTTNTDYIDARKRLARLEAGL